MLYAGFKNINLPLIIKCLNIQTVYLAFTIARIVCYAYWHYFHAEHAGHVPFFRITASQRDTDTYIMLPIYGQDCHASGVNTGASPLSLQFQGGGGGDVETKMVNN